MTRAERESLLAWDRATRAFRALYDYSVRYVGDAATQEYSAALREFDGPNPLLTFRGSPLAAAFGE